MSIFANKTLMITGGTGSFGNAVLNRFLDTDVREIRIFSERSQCQMNPVRGKIKRIASFRRMVLTGSSVMNDCEFRFRKRKG